MATLNERPKRRLVLFSLLTCMGLALIVLVIMVEFIHPHNPKEPKWVGIAFMVLALVPTVSAIWGMVEAVKELKNG
jgi:drug/metabolite transporter (DMT)-like permease